jgi:Cu/Ag efflux protein CusF
MLRTAITALRSPIARGLGTALFSLTVLASMPLSPASAQAPDGKVVGEADTIMMRATVKSVDYQERTLTLVEPSGAAKTLKVGDEVRNFQQIQPGDEVVVRYSEAVALVIAPPGSKIPEDQLALAGARAAKGEKPAGGAAERIVVTGIVTSVDPSANKISLVDPGGGKIQTLSVKNAEYQSMLGSIKVGDTITAIISQAVVAAVQPAQ